MDLVLAGKKREREKETETETETVVVTKMLEVSSIENSALPHVFQFIESVTASPASSTELELGLTSGLGRNTDSAESPHENFQLVPDVRITI